MSKDMLGSVVRAVVKEPATQLPLLSIVATTNLPAVAGKKTKQCFTDGWYYRDADFDNWLPASQPDASECVITTLALTRNWTFIEAAQAILGVDTTDVVVLGNALIKSGHPITLAQAEAMKKATERGDNTGMRTDGWGNFFFVETGDLKNPVSVGRVDRDDRGWLALVYRLGSGSRWYAGFRPLLRNVDASKLGL